jgi:hypothetical protein
VSELGQRRRTCSKKIRPETGRSSIWAVRSGASRDGRFVWASTQSVALPLEYLRQLGVVPPPVRACPAGPLEELLADYGRYLSVERGLCEHTVLDAYVPAARLFLCEVGGSDGLDLARLAAADVSSFLARECPRRSVSGARHLVCALRSLLRYLHLAGLITTSLVWSVPSVADLRDRTLPRGLEPAAVRGLLASCDRRRLVGRRDFAVLLSLARLGLRAGESTSQHCSGRSPPLLRGRPRPTSLVIGPALSAQLRVTSTTATSPTSTTYASPPPKGRAQFRCRGSGSTMSTDLENWPL